MKIVLTGFMGAGKSTVAQLLAQELGIPAIEMDDHIVKRSKRRSVNEIFVRDGETKFREFEIEVAQTLRSAKDVVISTGGGVIMNKVSLDYLRQNGTIVFLLVTFANALKRIAHEGTRPLIADKKSARHLYNLRLPLYRAYADIIVSTDHKTATSVAKDITRRLA